MLASSVRFIRSSSYSSSSPSSSSSSSSSRAAASSVLCNSFRKIKFATSTTTLPPKNINRCHGSVTSKLPLSCCSSLLDKHYYYHQQQHHQRQQERFSCAFFSPMMTSSVEGHSQCWQKRQQQQQQQRFMGYSRNAQYRSFSSKDITGQSKQEEKDNNNNKNSNDGTTNKIESDESSASSPPTTTVTANTTTTDDPLSFTLPKTTTPHGPSASELTETQAAIARNQRLNIELSRARTTSNVTRALNGNLIIAVAKLGAWVSSGSSAMLSEFIHSCVDCGNQGLLLIGLRDSGHAADNRHPYGYGKSVYFWALVSALGTFFLGAGVSMTHAVGELMEPSFKEVTWEIWGVLGISFTVEGYVLYKTIRDVKKGMIEEQEGNNNHTNKSLWEHVKKIRDPATLAVLLEDGAACLGIVMAIAGISAVHATSMPVFDGIAGVGISGLLASMGLILVRVNHRFLLGQGVDQEIVTGIEKILLRRRSIDHVHSVQSQWTGPDTFSYKAEVDFDGTFLAAKLMPRYQREFLEARSTLDQDLRVLLSWYAEDVMRAVEREVHHIEAEIRKEYPGAEYIELEPMGKDADKFAIDDGMEAELRRIEIESLNRYLKSMYQVETTKKKKVGKVVKQEGGSVNSSAASSPPPSSSPPPPTTMNKKKSNSSKTFSLSMEDNAKAENAKKGTATLEMTDISNDDGTTITYHGSSDGKEKK